MNLPNILEMIDRQSKTGTLVLRLERRQAHIFFRDGAAIAADENYHPLDGVLARAGKKLSPTDSAELARMHTTETIFHVSLWEAGDFIFHAGAPDAPFEVSPIPANLLALECTRRVQEWPKLKSRVPSYEIVLAKRAALPPREPFSDASAWVEESRARSKTTIGACERRIYELADGRRTLEDLIVRSRLGEFETVRAALNLVDLGMLTLETTSRSEGALWVCPACKAVYTADVKACPIDGNKSNGNQLDPLIGCALERYRIVDLIGIGAMGRVYHARHTAIDREYAIKILFSDVARNPALLERFRREAAATSRVHHENVVSIFDFVESSAKVYLVMELVRGKNLAQLIDPGPFTLLRAATIARQIAAGLSAAHEKGLVHRDVKPANIMIDGTSGREVVKILDFGMVGFTGPAPRKRLTEEGLTLGTASYMAPEQARDPAVGPKADLYSLGVILFEMLTGRTPFAESALRTKALTKPLTLRDAGGLERLVDRLLEPSPEARIASAEALVWDLDQLIPQLPDAPLPPPAVDPTLFDQPDTETVSDRPPVSDQIAPEPPPPEKPASMTHELWEYTQRLLKRARVP